MPDGSSATESGIYQFKFQTPHGCDSTMVVELEVTDSSLTINELGERADEQCCCRTIIGPMNRGRTFSSIRIFWVATAH